MIFSEVQRTLVKSPPELWAEISDPESLARHLGEFGEIRITRVHPEQKVEWEAGDASGTIAIKPSGWGTKVKLTVTREGPEPELASEPEQAPEPELQPDLQHDDLQYEDLQHEATAAAVAPALADEPEPPLAPELVDGNHDEVPPEPAHEAVAGPEPRRGFLARLFRRRRAPRTHEPPLPLEPEDHGEVAAEELAPDHDAGVAHEPIEAAEPMPHLDAPGNEAAEVEVAKHEVAGHEAADDLAAEQAAAVLRGVLDRLGAAHHRPFSRA
jgi:hypothetical protein